MRQAIFAVFLAITVCSLISNSSISELGNKTKFESPTSAYLIDDLVANVLIELPSTGESNIVSIDSNGESYVACGSFNGTLTTFGISSSSSRDIVLIHQTDNAEPQALAVEVDGDSECLRVVHKGNNQSTLVGWFDGTLSYGNTSIASDGKAGFALSINHISGEVLNHYVMDSAIPGQSDYLYGVDQLAGGGFVVVGSSKGNLSNQSQGLNQASCSEICGVVAILNNSLAVREFTYISGSKGVVAKDVAQHTVTDTLLVVGNYLDDLHFEDSTLTPPSSNGKADIFIAKYVMGQGWENSLTVGGAESDVPHSITKQGTTHFITALVTHDTNYLHISSGATISSTVGGKDILILEVDGYGNYINQQIIGSSGDDYPGDLVWNSGFFALTGALGGELVDDGVTYGQNEHSNMLVAKIDLTGQGNDQYFTSSGSSSPEGRGNGITVLDNGTIIIGGRLKPSTTYIDYNNVGGTISTGVVVRLYDDQDNDGIATSVDNCPMVANTDQADLDGDTLGDVCDDDRDNDGFDDPSDDCPNLAGNSTKGKSGCPDSDNDSWANDVDDCPGIAGVSDIDRNGCRDSDGDGYSNPDDEYTAIEGADAFPNEMSQWRDWDGDGFGDNTDGFEGDYCPYVPGPSIYDRFGCPDTDGDGFSDPSENWNIADGADQFISEPTQWADSDGDGFGDNFSGVEGDTCPAVYGLSTADVFGCIDTDGDGYADMATDAFPYDYSQHADRDGDGFGDNPKGVMGDACPDMYGTSVYDRFGCFDQDGDGYSNPDEDWGISDGADAFSNDQTQWGDDDNDGFGNNASGYEGDACPTEFGLSFVDRLGCPDNDADGLSNPDANWRTEQGADYCPDDANDACLDYILTHPTSLIIKHGAFVIPTLLFVFAIFRKLRQRQLRFTNDESVNLTILENGDI